jgi:DNA-binding MarR family transcriptional regulator
MRPPVKWQLQRPEPDDDGRLYHPGIRRTLTEMGRGTPTLALEALSALRLLSKHLHDEFQQWTAGHGLSESRFRVLMTIFMSPDRQLPLGELAERLDVVPRTMTGLVDVLERDGLVVRIPDVADRRSTLAALTEAGLERIETIRKSSVVQQAATTRGMTPDQLAELRHLCWLLLNNLDRARS